MYQAKEQRTTARIYDPTTDSHTPERLALAADLRAALADDSFALGYQPIKALASDQVIGVEVLARWEHPTRGLLPPPMYIEVAEQSDLIRTLTSYVLRHALEQRNEWASAGPRPACLSQRVRPRPPPRRLRRRGTHLLADTGNPDGRLVLELTETQALHHPERIAPVLTELRSRGVVIAIDDFGTGYSSLTSLRSLPVDEIKIDKSFVATMTTNATRQRDRPVDCRARGDVSTSTSSPKASRTMQPRRNSANSDATTSRVTFSLVLYQQRSSNTGSNSRPHRPPASPPLSHCRERSTDKAAAPAALGK